MNQNEDSYRLALESKKIEAETQRYNHQISVAADIKIVKIKEKGKLRQLEINSNLMITGILRTWWEQRTELIDDVNTSDIDFRNDFSRFSDMVITVSKFNRILKTVHGPVYMKKLKCSNGPGYKDIT
jgi:hypothetical protein